MPFDSPWFWLVTLLGVTLTGVSKAGFAGSLGVVTVPLLSLVMPLERAAAMMLPILIVMDAKVIHYYYKSVNWPVLRAVIPAAILGVGLGAWAMGSLPKHWLQGVLGLVCLLFASWHKLNQALGLIPGARWLWGCVAGFTSTLIHAGGPPISIYFAGCQIAKLQWLATAAIFFGLTNWVKVGPYLYLGLWSRDTLIMVPMLLPVAWLGVWLGKKIQKRFSDENFILVSRVLVFSAGVLLLGKALHH